MALYEQYEHYSLFVWLLMLFSYLYSAICLMAIAWKTNNEDKAFWAWIPFTNLMLMLKIANKPLWWLIPLIILHFIYYIIIGYIRYTLEKTLLLSVIPLFIYLFLTIIYILIWCDIARALGKNSWFGVFSRIPVVNIPALSYLAFSDLSAKFKSRLTSVIDVLLIAGILVLINIFSIGEFRRVDLTQNHEYTISKSTKKILSELDDIVNVKIFMSEELPPQFLGLKRQITDMMDEFQAYANSNFRLRYIDPKEDPKYKQEADMAQIPEVSVKVVQQDEVRVVQAYLGILIEHENKTESIPVVASVDNLEYDMMSRIVKVLKKENELPSIGILQGHGEPSTSEGNQQQQQPPGDLALFVKKLRDQYNAFDVKLENRSEVSANVKTLVVVNPDTIPETELYAIDQFIMNGGNMVCFINGIKGFDNLNQPATPFSSGINDLLTSYGIKLNSDLVLDQNSELAEFRTGQFSMIRKQYPFWIKIRKENFSQTSPVTGNLESAVFQWPSSIELLKDKLNGIESDVLVKSSAKSWLMTKEFNTSPMQDFNVMPTGDQFNLAVNLKGVFTSYFDGKTRPTDPQTGQQVGGGEKPYKSKSAPTQIVVISTQLPLMNYNWNPQQQQISEIQTFVLNIFDSLNLGDELIGIRSRTSTNRPINPDRVKTTAQKLAIRFMVIGAVPILLILAGIIRFVLRRGRKKRFEREFKAKEAAE